MFAVLIYLSIYLQPLTSVIEILCVHGVLVTC